MLPIMKKAIQLISLTILLLFSHEVKAQQVTHRVRDLQVRKEPYLDDHLLKSAQILNETQNLLDQSYQNYSSGNLQESENLLRQVLEVFGGDNSNQSNFELPYPGGVRRRRFNIPGIFSFESTRSVSSEVTVFDTTAVLPLEQLYNLAVSRISSNPLGFQLSGFQASTLEQFGGCLLSGSSGSRSCLTFPSPSQIQTLPPEMQEFYQDLLPTRSSQEVFQRALDFASNSNENRNIHSTLKDTFDLIQMSLVAQGSQEKYEEALLFSEMSRTSEFARIAPIILYGLLNYETISNNSSYSRHFDDVSSYDFSLQTVKRIARRQNATVVYYSTVASGSEKNLFIWVIKPSGDISFRNVELSGLEVSLNELVRETLIASGKFIDRGQQGRALLQAVRDLRSQGYEQETNLADLAEKYLVEESVQNSKLRLLYSVLIEPVSDLLPTDPNSHVIFVPHRDLTLAPFAALQDSEGRYLIEKHTISISHSLNSLREQIDPIRDMPTGKEFVAAGNSNTPPDLHYTADNSPVFLPDLPAADSEVVDVSPDGYWFRRDAATQSRINRHLEDAKIIHFATHGLLNFRNKREFLLIQLLEEDKNQTFYVPQAPRNVQWNSDSDFTYKLWYDRSLESRSWQTVYAKLDLPGAIILSDLPLTAEDILALDLEADLVVLSACNSGRGIPTESTILGLPLAFGLAGVPRVIVSQWSVPDQSTRLLMIAFYESMERSIAETGKANVAGALREAMLRTKNIEGYGDPIFWAGFTMMNVAH